MQKTETRSSKRQRQREPEAKQEPTSAASLKQPAIIAVLIAIVTFAVLSGVCHHPFFGVDDSINVYANPHLAGANGTDASYFWDNAYFRIYMPVTDTVWAITADASRLPKPIPTPDGTLSDFDPSAFHTVNLVFHVLTVLVAFLILRLLLRERNPRWSDWAAGAGALVYGLHPAQIEPVAWVTSLNTVLSGFFSFTAIYFYLQYALAARDGQDSGKRYLFFGLATGAYILGLLSKPTAVAVPLIALALDCIALKRPIKQIWSGLALWLLFAVMLVAKTQAAQTGERAIQPVAVWFRPFMACDALTFYIKKLFVPLNLSVDYGRTPAYIQATAPWRVTWLIPVAIAGVLWWRRKQWSIVAAGASVFLAGLLPMLGLAPHYYHGISVVADRYLYMALLGPALILAWLMTHEKWGAPARAVGLVAVVLLSWRSMVQVTYWRDTMAIVRHSADISPNAWFARNNLATALDKAGKPAEALPYARDAVRIKPDYAKTHEILGIILNELGQTNESAEQFAETVKLTPDDAEAHFNYAVLLAKQGDIQGAIANYRDTLRLGGPGYPGAQGNLDMLLNGQTAPAPPADPAAAKYAEGADLAHQNKIPEAMALFREALAINPKFEPAHADLAVALYQQGAVPEAIEHFRAALRLMPNSAEVHYNLGAVLNGQGKKAEAAEHLQAALKIKPDYAQARTLLNSIEKQ